MVRVTLQGYSRDFITDRVKWFKPFHEIHKTEADARFRALAMNWVVVDVEEIKPEAV